VPVCGYTITRIDASLEAPAIIVTFAPQGVVKLTATLLDGSNAKVSEGTSPLRVNVTYWETWYALTVEAPNCKLTERWYVGPKNPTGNGDPIPPPVVPPTPTPPCMPKPPRITELGIPWCKPPRDEATR
jgi:hypothetical protein